MSELSIKIKDRHIKKLHRCVDCGKERLIQFYYNKPQNLRCKSCAMKLSHKIRDKSYYKHGKECYQWKGGRHKDANGYIVVWINPASTFYSMANKKGFAMEHRMNMARYLGRCLQHWEIVHHKNGIKDDNRLDNLELLPSKAYHTVDSYTKSYISKLERRVTLLEAELIVLNRQIEEVVIQDRMCHNFP